MQMLGETNRAKAIELLSERLAFTRAAVSLYDAVLERLQSRGGPYATLRGHLRVIREEKKAQEEWLEETLRAFGGDTEQAPAGSPLPEEWTNILAGLSEDAAPSRFFESLLAAEVYDSGGWERLLDLAQQACDDDAADEFRQRLHEEEEHFLFVGRIVARFARGPTLEDEASSLEAGA